MPGRPTTRQMSDTHEKFIAELIGGRRTPGSGNQFANQTDVRNDNQIPYGMAADGKSTLASSISIKRSDWDKLVEQAHGLIPILPIRFYPSYDLRHPADFVLLDAKTFDDLLWTARSASR